MDQASVGAIEARVIVEVMQPMLAGRGPDVQGAIIAQLLSTWLTGHPVEVREETLQIFLHLTRQLMTVDDAERGTHASHH